MKKIALITSNKIFAQSFESAMESISKTDFELILLLNPSQALLDAEILEIDVALIDMSLFDPSNNDAKESGFIFCKKLNKILPACKLLLLVSQDDLINRKMAIEAKEKKIIDDYVFLDLSLKYLFAKIATLK